MKLLRFSFLTSVLCLSTLITASAQQGNDLKAEVSPSAEQKTPIYEQPQFDPSAGRQESSFEDLSAYIDSHLTYPDLALRHSIEGKVSILVEISATGKISSKKVVHSMGYGCDEAALALIDNMPAWTPASNYGVPVRSKKIIELNFRLR
jgi:TonB family protein